MKNFTKPLFERLRLSFVFLLLSSSGPLQSVALAHANSVDPSNSASAQSIPIEFSDKGHMFLRVRVNNSHPQLFGLDSGFEQTAITTRLAKALNLKLYGESKVTGVGEGDADIAFARNVRFELPGTSFQIKEVGALDLDFPSPIPGEPIAGILGYDFISRFVVKIDYVGKVMELHAPRGYRYRGSGSILTIRMIDNYPSVPATVVFPGLSPIRTWLGIDSGADSGIFFNSPFVKKHRLLNSQQETTEAKMLGIGGTSKIRIGRASSIRLGRAVIDRPVVHLSLATKGDGANPLSAGQISNYILRQFDTVIFDHARRRLILEGK
ncbi:MAG TPA: retropepsin-like aspartic protease [Pyrinomonadaceae bacterium]|nr:retropepsin-like aspartic protease [Pyrinomonadaceae bacterium]